MMVWNAFSKRECQDSQLKSGEYSNVMGSNSSARNIELDIALKIESSAPIQRLNG
jgi:hypothetical protein